MEILNTEEFVIIFLRTSSFLRVVQKKKKKSYSNYNFSFVRGKILINPHIATVVYIIPAWTIVENLLESDSFQETGQFFSTSYGWTPIDLSCWTIERNAVNFYIPFNNLSLSMLKLIDASRRIFACRKFLKRDKIAFHSLKLDITIIEHRWTSH